MKVLDFGLEAHLVVHVGGDAIAPGEDVPKVCNPTCVRLTEPTAVE